MHVSSAIRPAAVAGLFYPADAGRLRDTVDALYAAARPVASPGTDPSAGERTLAVVAPHAGYPYSGALAARAFDALRGADVHTVVVIGPSHVEAFPFTSVFTGEAYRTPLGDVPVDAELARALAEAHPTIRASDRGHVQPHLPRGEHSIEVELPFLQRAFPDARIVPIVMGDPRWPAVEALGRALRRLAAPGTVIVASSDLSHFHAYDRAVHLDAAFLEALAAMDARRIHDDVAAGRCEACGAAPVAATVLATAGAGRRVDILGRANSGDVTGDRTSVVGYAAAAVRQGVTP